MNTRLMSAYAIAAALSVSALNPLSAAVQGAKPISQAAPAYPAHLRAAFVEGEVVVSFTITPSGDVTNAQVVSSTNRKLEDPALDAVRQWKFEPAKEDGVAIREKAFQSIAFVMPELHADSAARLVVSNSKPASQSANQTSVN